MFSPFPCERPPIYDLQLAQVNLERVSCKNENCADECDNAADDFGDDIGLFAARKQLSGDDAGRIDERLIGIRGANEGRKAAAGSSCSA